MQTPIEKIDAYRLALEARVVELSDKITETHAKLRKLGEARAAFENMDPVVAEALAGLWIQLPNGGVVGRPKKNYGPATEREFRSFLKDNPQHVSMIASHFKLSRANANAKACSMAKFGVLRRVAPGTYITAD